MPDKPDGQTDCVQYKPCRKSYLKGGYPYPMDEVCNVSCFNYIKKAGSK